MPGFLTPYPAPQQFDENGDPIAGAFAGFFITGTDTPTPTYADSDLDVENDNPVEADSGGYYPAIYLDPGIQYKVVLYDANMVELPGLDRDPVPGVISQTGSSLDFDVTGSATGSLVETTLATMTIPANTLVENGQAVMVRVWGSLLSVSAGDRTIRVKLNGTSYSTLAYDSPNNTDWMVELQIMRTGANAQNIGAHAVVGTPTWNDTTAALTETNAITVTVTAQNGATASPTSGADLTFSGGRIWRQ